MEVSSARKFVFINGQVPGDEQFDIPCNFVYQCELLWKNIKRQLNDAGMDLAHVLKITAFIPEPKYRREIVQITRKVLGEHQPVITIFISEIFDQKWLVQIEVIAANTNDS